MAEDYARHISKQVVAQLAEREGFSLAHGNALDALADVMNRFIREIGTYAKDYAEIQGRTDANVLDVVDGLQDLGFTPEQLLEHVQQQSQDPYLHTVPQFPVRRLVLQPPTFKSTGVEPPAHIPSHLPAFPAAHTIKFTQLPRHKRPDTQAEKPAAAVAEPAQDGQPATNAQESLIALHQRLQASSGAVRANPFIAVRDAQKKRNQQTASEKRSSEQGSVWLPDIARHIIKQEAEAMQGAMIDQPLAPTTDKPSSSKKRRQQKRDDDPDWDDDEDMDLDDEHLEATPGPSASQPGQTGGWKVTEMDEDILQGSPRAFAGLSAGVALSLAATGAAAQNALQERYSVSRKDAFMDEVVARAGETGARRRASLHNPDNAKKLRAQDILETGADAILMEYPEGYVPRQGTQRARDDVPV